MKDRILAMLGKQLMTTDELCKELHVARSTVAQALNTLHGQGLICIAAYRPTGSSPARLWGLGATDVAPPPLQTAEARNERRKERARLERERLCPPPQSVARCDIAAAWLKNPLR